MGASLAPPGSPGLADRKDGKVRQAGAGGRDSPPPAGSETTLRPQPCSPPQGCEDQGGRVLQCGPPSPAPAAMPSCPLQSPRRVVPARRG